MKCEKLECILFPFFLASNLNEVELSHAVLIIMMMLLMMLLLMMMLISITGLVY